jgi:hypothetical protein
VDAARFRNVRSDLRMLPNICLAILGCSCRGSKNLQLKAVTPVTRATSSSNKFGGPQLLRVELEAILRELFNDLKYEQLI